MSEMSDDAFLVAGQAVSLLSLVTERLRMAIITGRFPPGSQLRERELCELTGVSRNSVREALRRLEAEGLVSAAHNRGLIVTSFSPDEVTHLYDLRRLLESYAAKEFARLRKPEDLETLRAAIAKLDHVQRGGTPLEILEVGSEIHAAIAAGSQNPYIVETLQMLFNRIALVRFIGLQQESRNAKTFDELRAISKAIIAGDGNMSERLCDEHLRDIGAEARNIVELGYKVPERV
jgi:DNA-binding GntR family transcriptional regulator